MEVPLFIPNQEYRRRAIHSQFGGNWQGGICPSSKYPFIFVFTGKSGGLHGYKDLWENDNIFSYTGEGQSGNMEFTRGNLALYDHVKNGKRVFLFEQTRKGFVKFVSELTFFDCDYFPTFDTEGKERMGIKFFFKRTGAILTYELEKHNLVAEPLPDFFAPTVTERSGLVVSRVGQGAYRKSIINRWENRCAVTGFNDKRILIASHIHPWKDAKSEERLDVSNGILLSPTYDALFDKHLITFEHSGKIVLSDDISYDQYKKVGVTGKEIIKNLHTDNIPYLELHQKVFQSG
ncbi:MAG: HNH endonuclease signature motif containing protein [Cyclobacteriaceae bacterium]